MGMASTRTDDHLQYIYYFHDRDLKDIFDDLNQHSKKIEPKEDIQLTHTKMPMRKSFSVRHV